MSLTNFHSPPAEKARPGRRAGTIVTRLAATVMLVAAGKLGLVLATLHGNISAVWPATGVAIWMLVVFDTWMWPLVTAGIFVVEIGFAGFPFLSAAWLAFGSTIEALAGAWLWRVVSERWRGESRDAVAMVTTALVAPVASATVGAIVVVAAGAVTVTMPELSITWWMGDAIGALALLPVLLAAPELGRMARGATLADAGKAALVLLLAAGVSWLSFVIAGGGMFLFSIFPVLLLAMVWFGAAGVRVVALLIAIAGIAAEFGGRGLLGGGNVHSNLLNLQVFLASVAGTALVLPVFRLRGNMLLPISVLLVGWTLSGWLFTTIQRDGRRRQEGAFNERVAAAEAAIRVRSTSYVDALLGGASFFATSKTVGREDWRVYAESLQLAKRYPGINGIGIIYAVKPDEVSDWLARMRADGAPNLAIKSFPATTGSEDDVKYVITLIEPSGKNAASIGRNIATEPSRRLAAELSRDTGEPRMNRRIPGSRDAQRRSGFLLYVPLYRKGAPVETVAQRRAAHVGWVYAQFFADNFLNGVLGPMGETLNLHFFEDGELNREHLLYASAPAGGNRGEFASTMDVMPRFESVTAMAMGGQRFRLGWQRGPKYVGSEPRPVAWTAVSFSLATLLLAGLVLNLQTSRRRAQTSVDERTRELSAARSRLQGVLNGTTFSVIATTPEGIIEVFNAGAERMLGYASDELAGRHTPEIIHLADEMKARAITLSAQLGRTIAPGFEVFVALTRLGGTDEQEWTYVRKDGSRLPVLLSVTALRDGGGAISGFLGIAQDITARKQMQALREEELSRLSKLGSQVPGVIYQFRLRPDGSSCFPYASDGIRKIFRVTPEEVRADASSAFAAMHPDDLPAVMESIQISARTLQPWVFEYRTCFADGTVRWLLGNSVPEREADGSVLWHGFITDITDQKNLERNLAVARDQALEASRLKSEFLATMSHEIRTPMNAIIGMAGLLADMPLNSEQADMVRILSGGAENLLVIVNDILDFSRIEAGQLRLDRTDFDLQQVVEETVALLTMPARAKGLPLTCRFNPAPQWMLLGDGGRVRQILLNLIGNAVKFTETGEVVVTAGVVREANERIRVRLTVQDTGVGIPLEARDRLFRPFVQVDGSSTRRFGGTGLGLAITQQLVSAMGGEVGFESEFGRGSLFWVELEFPRRGPVVTRPPAGSSRLAEDDIAQHPHVILGQMALDGVGFDAAAEDPPWPSLRLLLVEDNSANQQVASMLLNRMGHTVELAANGKEALARLAGQDFDAVLMDCQMPVLDGYEATRRIRSGQVAGVDARVPTIALTAYTRNEDLARCRAAGMDAYVAKPIRVAELQAAFEGLGLGRLESSRPERPADGVLDVATIETARALPGSKGASLLPELIELYLSDERERLERIERLVVARAGPEVADEAHSFGGNAVSFGALEVRGVALELEVAARGSDWPGVSRGVTRLRDACERLRMEIGRCKLLAK